MRLSIRLCVAILLALLLAGCQGLAGEPRVVATIAPSRSVESSPSTNENIAAVMTLGGQVWQDSCMRCHGTMGEGTSEGAPLPDLTGLSDERILASIANGVRDVMPAFGEDLTPEQLNAAMTYAKMMSLAIARDMVNVPDASESAAAAADEVMGTVSGQVRNGTVGGALPASLSLSLHVVKSDTSLENLETQMNADGTFQFANVPISAGYQYVVTASYGEATFISEIGEGSLDQLALTLPVTIYEMGADASAIVIQGVSAQAFVQNGMLRVVQIVQFVNTSDRVFVPSGADDAQSIGLRLPAGAQVQSTMSQSQVVSSDGRRVIDTRPVLAGGTQLMHVAYSLPYSGNVTVEQVFDYPVAGRVDILLGNADLQLSAEGLTDLGMMTISSGSLKNFGGEVNIAAGTPFRYVVSGTPTTSTTLAAQGTTANPIAYLLIGAGVVALVVALALALRDRLSGGKPTVSNLLEAIADLDAQHSAGTLDERAYTRKRAALKAQLTVLMKAQGQN